MKRKSGIVLGLLALLLLNALSFEISLQPAKADAQNTTTVQFYNTLGGQVSMTNEKTHSSTYSAKLVLSSSSVQGSNCMVLYSYNKTLNSLQSFQVFTSYTNASPRFVIALDLNSDGLTDLLLLSDYQFTSDGNWQQSQGGQRWGWSEASTQLSTYGKVWNILNYWKGIYGNATVLSVGVALEYWGVKDSFGFDQPLYADEVIINGVTYNIAASTNQISNEPSPDDWSTYRHDMQRTGLSTSPVSSGELLWQFYTGLPSGDSASTRLRSSPAITNGVVYFASNNSYFYALNSTSGAVIWKVKTISIVDSSPTVVNGVVYFGLLWNGYGGYLDALNTTDGSLIWQFTCSGGIESSPAVTNGVVYAGSSNRNVYALNATNGALIWSFLTGGSIFSSPAIVNGVVYIGSRDGKLYALNADNGAIIWAFQTGDQVHSSPSVVNDVVYFNSDIGNVYALRASDGSEIWQANVGSCYDHADDSPAVSNGIVYAGSRNGYYAFNATNGSQIWFFTSPYSPRQTTGYVYSSPAVSGNVMYFGSCDGYVFALNALNGNMIWAFRTGIFVFTSPAIANGIVYVGSYDGYLYALGSLNGITPTPTPTPKPTETPSPTATPTPITNPKPTATPIQTPDPTPPPQPPQQPFSTPVAAIAIQPSEGNSDNWILLAVIIITALSAMIALSLIFKKPEGAKQL